MSGIIASAAAALTTAATVLVATFPEASQAFAPLFEPGNEYAALTAGLLVSIPGLALLTVIAGAARD
jgi:hypothetical protein